MKDRLTVRSVSGWIDPFVACAAALAAYAAFSRLPISNRVLAILIVAFLIAVMVLLEWAHAPRPTTPPTPFKEAISHTLVSSAGTLVGFVITLLGWNLLAEYYRGYYAPFFDTLPVILVAAPVAVLLFTFLSIRTLGHVRTGEYELGLLACGRVKEIDWGRLRDGLLVWFLRAFFLPINFVEIVWTVGIFRGQELSLLSNGWAQAEYYVLLMIYALIVTVVAPGYLFSSRFLNTGTKAISSSWFGWTVTLACYSPFVGAVFGAWFDYNPGVPSPRWAQPWVVHLQEFPTALAIAGGAILLLALVHLWGEAQFTLRSSNLANRGIITTGPYRFTKHPIYVTKCIGWLLIWMPFASGLSLLNDVRLTILWICVCGIYALRALAEEQLLASDPDYVAYATWMDKHGLFRFVGKWVPLTSFSSRLAHWQKRPPAGVPKPLPPPQG